MFGGDTGIYDKEFIDNLLDDLFEFLTFNRVVLQRVNQVLEKSNRRIEEFNIENHIWDNDEYLDLANRHIYKWMNNAPKQNLFKMATDYENTEMDVFSGWFLKGLLFGDK